MTRVAFHSLQAAARILGCALTFLAVAACDSALPSTSGGIDRISGYGPITFGMNVAQIHLPVIRREPLVGATNMETIVYEYSDGLARNISVGHRGGIVWLVAVHDLTVSCAEARSAMDAKYGAPDVSGFINKLGAEAWEWNGKQKQARLSCASRVTSYYADRDLERTLMGSDGPQSEAQRIYEARKKL